MKFPTGKDEASAQYNDGGRSRSPSWRRTREVRGRRRGHARAVRQQAEQQYGAVPLADLNQGATTDFPIEGYVVTKAWAAAEPEHAQAVPAALSAGQEIADTDRSAVEKAFEGLNGAPKGRVPSSGSRP